MLKQKLIPTTLVDPAETRPIEIVAEKQRGRFQTIRLVFRLIGFGLTSLWMMRVRKCTPLAMAIRTRAFLEDLGGLWIKAGQLISLRADLLSPEMADELTQLQFRAYGFAPEIARRIIEDALGQPIEQVYDVFEAHPFAAASISQVHRGRLRKTGDWVAIKVQRPDISKIFERDLKLISWLLRQLNHLPTVSFIAWDGMIRELQQIIREEIDYRYEISNLRRLRKILRRHKIYVPKVYRSISSQQVIVMEFVKGVLMSDYLRIERKDPQRTEVWRQENNIKPYTVGSRLMRSFYRQLFEDNLFHGDLHPGNIMLLRNSRIALIDMGTLGNLEARFVEIYKMQAKAFSEHDYAKAADYYLLLCDSIPVMDLDAYRAETVEVYRNWEARTHLHGLTFVQKSITGGVATEASEIARKYKVNPTWQLLRVGRSLATLDANLSTLLGDANPAKIIKKYFRQAQTRGLDRLRKRGIGNLIGGAVGEATVIGRFFTDNLRRDAIRFQGIQQRAHYFFAMFANLMRWGFLIGAVILAYDYLHQHHFDLMGGLHPKLGNFGQIVERIAPYPAEFALLAIFVVLVFFIIFGKIKGRLTEKTIRLPNGRLDN